MVQYQVLTFYIPYMAKIIVRVSIYWYMASEFLIIFDWKEKKMLFWHQLILIFSLLSECKNFNIE